jgi:hypothetical protein
MARKGKGHQRFKSRPEAYTGMVKDMGYRRPKPRAQASSNGSTHPPSPNTQTILDAIPMAVAVKAEENVPMAIVVQDTL